MGLRYGTFPTVEMLESHPFCDSGLSDNQAKINIGDKQKVRIIGGKNRVAPSFFILFFHKDFSVSNLDWFSSGSFS